MTDNDPSDSAVRPSGRDDPRELERFLADYRPKNVSAAIWGGLSTPAAALVLSAGVPTRLRVEKDVQLLGALVAHLVDRGRPVTLDEALTDATLLSFDASLVVSGKTRENKRGIARRLQAAHRGLPWRTARMEDGQRIKKLIRNTQLVSLDRVLRLAIAEAGRDTSAAAFVAAVDGARARRRGSVDGEVNAQTWETARAFSASHGLHLTRTSLRSLITHEVLALAEPAAVIVARYGLTRRDLDLALTQLAALPTTPTSRHLDLLRGRR